MANWVNSMFSELHNILDTYRSQSSTRLEKIQLAHKEHGIDYQQFELGLFDFEVIHEIELLQTLLKDPNTFIQKFKDRCLYRGSHPEDTISIMLAPNAPANKLYWDFTKAIFSPKTVADYLEILMPSITKQIRIGIRETMMKKSLKEERESLIPQVTVIPHILDLCDSEPVIDDLLQYVFHPPFVFAIKDIELFDTKLHSKVWAYLCKDQPELSKNLYNHNASMKVLKIDIQNYLNNGRSPYDYIQAILEEISKTGESSSGNQGIYAGNLANELFDGLLNYLNALPEDKKEELYALEGYTRSGDRITFENLLNDYVYAGECVELITEILTSICKENSNKLFLKTPVKMDESAQKALMTKYGPKGHNLTLSKEVNLESNLPELLVKKLIEHFQTINIHSSLQLTTLLKRLSANAYETLWRNVHFSVKSFVSYLEVLYEEIDDNVYRPPQISALKLALANYLKQHDYPLTYLLQLFMRFNDVESFSEAFSIEAMDDKQPSYENFLGQLINRRRFCSFITHILSPEDLYRWFDSLDEDDLDSFISTNGTSFLKALPQNRVIEFLSTKEGENHWILGCIEDPDILSIILEQQSTSNYPDWHKIAIASPNTFQRMMRLMSPDKIKQLLKLENQNHQSLYQCLLAQPWIFYEAFKHLSVEHLGGIFNELGQVQMLFRKALQVDSVKTLAWLMEAHTKNTRAMFYTPFEDGKTVFHLCRSVKAVQCLIQYYPEKDLAAEWCKQDDLGRTIFHYQVQNPVVLTQLIQNTPEQDLLKIIFTADKYNKTPLHYSDSPIVKRMLIQIVPLQSRAELLKLIDSSGHGIFNVSRQFSSDELFQWLDVLELFDQDMRLMLFKILYKTMSKGLETLDDQNTLAFTKRLATILSNSDFILAIQEPIAEASPLIFLAADYESALAFILEYVGKEKKESILLTRDLRDNTLFHHAARCARENILRFLFNQFLEIAPLDLINLRNMEHQTVLHVAPYFTVPFLIKQVPETARLALLKTEDKTGNHILVRSNSIDGVVFNQILSLLPEQARVEAALLGTLNGQPLLLNILAANMPFIYYANSDSSWKKSLVEKFSTDQIKSLVNIQDKAGKCIGHYISDDPSACTALIKKLVTKDERLYFMTRCNYKGETVIESFIRKNAFSEWIKIMDLLTQDEQEFIFLKSAFKQKILREILDDDEDIELKMADSFVVDFLIVTQLIALHQPETDCNNRFFSKGNVFAKNLRKAESFDEIKNMVLSYLQNNPESPLSNDLLSYLSEGKTNDKKFTNLATRWLRVLNDPMDMVKSDF